MTLYISNVLELFLMLPLVEDFSCERYVGRAFSSKSKYIARTREHCETKA
jgi:hypothetical protein